MTITINHPQSGGFDQRKRALTAAAVAVVALLTVALLTQVTDSDPTTSAAPSATADQVVSVDQQAVLAGELAAIRAGSERSVPTVDQHAAFLSMNEIPWAPASAVPATAGTAESDLRFFLSINDVEKPNAPSAAQADRDRAFFLSINDVEE